MDQGNILVPLETACRALTEAKTVKGVKDIRDKAQAIAHYMKEQGYGLQAQNDAAELKLRAERKLGTLLADAPKEQGKRTDRTLLHGATKLQELGIERTQSHRWQRVASIPEATFERHIATAKERAQELTTASVLRVAKEITREEKRTENKQLVEGTKPIQDAMDSTYSTIVIDPPWDWADEGDVDQFGRSRPEYQTMPFEELLELPIEKLAQPNAHLYLWITNRSLPKGFALLERWGFRYVTCLTWCKPSIGMGNYYRGSTEHILFGVRGSLGLLQNNVGTWFAAPRAGEHSSKPEEFYTMVEECSPGPWLEMFARRERTGWHLWGAEA